VPGAIGKSWVKDQLIEGFMLDLSRIGLELWIEAVMNGRRPPKPLAPGELEGAVQAALQHWHQPSWLEHSPLARSAEVAIRAPGRTGGEAVRDALRSALAAARTQNSFESQLALQAVELAYIHNGTSYEAAAEHLAVSRATFYRLLKRGVQVLADTLTGPSETQVETA
jgi:DNA-directed RNA polymerase specialized sigma24 family protein